MSEKRLASSGDSFIDLTQMETVDLLNKLSDENTKLHKKVDEQQDQFSKLQANVEYLIDSKKELIEKIGEQQPTINELKEENERLRNQLERKTILLKIRTKHIDDREKSFHELLNYLESFCYKSNIDGNYAKQDIINILNNWEIREYD